MENVKFNIDDIVVYPSHGIGIVISEETEAIAGIECSFLIIELKKDNMTLRLPKNKAIKSGGLRHLSDLDTIEEVNNVLQMKSRRTKNISWNKRAQELESAVNSGDMVVIAAVVRDLAPAIENPECSYSERMIFESAFLRLAYEYAEVLNISLEETKVKIKSLIKSKNTVVEEA